MKWFIDNNRFVKHKGYFMFIPCVSIWYDKYRFLETGLYTPAFGLQIGWFNFSYGLSIQKGY
jgi:hypothetical protein